jgi:hypothetical protein
MARDKLELLYSFVVPSTFYVHLSSDAFELSRPVQHNIRQEAIEGLNRRFDKMNSGIRRWIRDRVVRLKGGRTVNQPPFQRNGPWDVQFAEDRNLNPDESLFELSCVIPALDADATSHLTRRRGRAIIPVFAVIEYSDTRGLQRYEIRKHVIIIGRPSDGFAPDVEVLGNTDISRRHARIRRDPASGQFYIQDLSHRGTWLNGVKLPPAAQHDGEEPDLNRETPLMDNAEIHLAGPLSMKFRRVRQ